MSVDIEFYVEFQPIFLMLNISRTHMQDLQEVTQEVHYENYRSERLAKGVKKNGIPNGTATNGKEELPPTAPLIISEKDRILQEKEAELQRMQEMLAQMQAKIAQK